MKDCKQIIFIGGPTASGKSALALEIAQSLGNCAIINADSLQLYADLQILSARPLENEFQGVPHYLYGVLSAHHAADAAWWQAQVLTIIDQLSTHGQRAIIVGGTGLYFTSLIRGLSAMPAIPPDIREHVRAQEKNLAKREFQEWAYAVDPLIEGRLSDSQRLSRALEVKLATGQSITTFQGNAKPVIDNFRFITLCPPREVLYERINQRFLAMMEAGAIAEVERLQILNLSTKAPILKALGVREITAHLHGEITLDTAVSLAQQASRNYAKRQITWFRHQVPQDIVITEITWDIANFVL
ncbi:MAG: tRNA (adenosine(37)-N6)-dimethylallyltransferase MiaA [Alphaproteobacteria bacterium]